MKAVVFTLGCKVNECESDSLINGLIERGYEVSNKLEYADLYIVNTCAVTSEAEKKSRQTCSRIAKFNPGAKIIFTGCACQKNPDSFVNKNPNHLVTGVFDKNKILSMLDKCGRQIAPQNDVYEELLPVKALGTRTFIKVQDGCNNFCSYCIIPYLRGRSRSRNPLNIKREIENAKSCEVVLTGINLSSYNYQGQTLKDLIICLKDVDTRIRLGSLEVNVIDEDFLLALKNLKNFAPHFHLSLQSGSDNVLRKMNRRYTKSQFIEKALLIKKIFKNCAITTDVIVGFPTETEKDFLETIEVIDRVGFADVHAFAFSPREGTVASKMQDLAPQIKKARLNVLLDKKVVYKEKFIEGNANIVLDFLPEDFKNGFTEGYSQNYIHLFVEGDLTGKGICKVIIKEKYLDGAIATLI